LTVLPASLQRDDLLSSGISVGSCRDFIEAGCATRNWDPIFANAIDGFKIVC
jgi:hypothetical protein